VIRPQFWVIRRVFWLTLGAVLGIAGYRRALALARSLTPSAQAGRLAGFAADVRAGMAEYMERHPAGGASTLESHGERRQLRGGPGGPARPARSRPPDDHDDDDDKDGR
jgi:hypothetical protein